MENEKRNSLLLFFKYFFSIFKYKEGLRYYVEAGAIIYIKYADSGLSLALSGE